jgi:eukaryotic-like serine/threonine-protein kinase
MERGSTDPAALCPACLIQGALESSPGDASKSADISPIGTARDDDYGRYRIVGTLGEGGMGTVYLAEQREPIRRRVALKVVKLGMDTSQVLARFANERQALAMMDHPNIAQIFDAGTTAAGRPYFVMEYIDGLPITRYCDRERLIIPERLALFLATCRAVQHAHQKGVIHRDLKPSNVLVTTRDGAAFPKVIDFGIATATDKWAVEHTLLTQFGQIVGTPEYASPEQADSMTGDVDESSDVYSLGVLVYELLIGVVPFDSAALRNAGRAEMLRIIREDEAPPLPQALTAIGTVAADTAARRQTDVASLRRLVSGDLNAIAMKALEKSRHRRYPSVSELAADVQRFIDGRSVLAKPRRVGHRTASFVRRRGVAVRATAAGLFCLLLGGLTAWSLSHRQGDTRPQLTDTDTIVLAEFDNKTGDPVFDDVLRQGLAVELQQSPFLSLVSDRRVHQMLMLMGRPAALPLTPEIAQQVCERTASAAILDGSIARLGGHYVLGLRARSCTAGTVLDEEQAVAPTREDVLNALSLIARRFRIRVGESLATVERHSTPLAEATTPSLEALKAYTAGLTVNLSAGSAGSIPFYRRAVDIDPQFAMAYANLGLAYSDAGDSVLSAENTTRAWHLRERVSDRERFFIDFTYDRHVTGNLDKAYQTLGLWLRTYPRGAEATPLSPLSLLGGLSTHGTGRFDEAIETSRKVLIAEPDFVYGYHNLASGLFFLDRFDEAARVLAQASERRLVEPYFLVVRYTIAVLKDDQHQMEQVVALARGKQGAEHRLAHAEALALARSGRLQAARRSSNRAMDLALQEGGRDTAASYQAARALWEGLYGNAAEGRKNAIGALGLSTGRDVEYVAGLALALCGDVPRSEALSADLERRFPEDTFAKFSYVPTLRAMSALDRGHSSTSVEHLVTALPYELAANGLNFNHFYLGGLHSAYVRGEALMAGRRYGEAAAEFQKILDHRGLVGADPIGAAVHLQLGRALARSGHTRQAKEAYQAFLTLWKNADAAIPVLKRAQAEYARL